MTFAMAAMTVKMDLMSLDAGEPTLNISNVLMKQGAFLFERDVMVMLIAMMDRMRLNAATTLLNNLALLQNGNATMEHVFGENSVVMAAIIYNV